MPIFTYACQDCGEKFDLLVGVTSEKPELKCSKCNGENIKKVFEAFSVGESKGKMSSSGPSCPTGTCSLG